MHRRCKCKCARLAKSMHGTQGSGGRPSAEKALEKFRATPYAHNYEGPPFNRYDDANILLCAAACCIGHTSDAVNGCQPSSSPGGGNVLYVGAPGKVSHLITSEQATRVDLSSNTERPVDGNANVGQVCPTIGVNLADSTANGEQLDGNVNANKACLTIEVNSFGASPSAKHESANGNPSRIPPAIKVNATDAASTAKHLDFADSAACPSIGAQVDGTIISAKHVDGSDDKAKQTTEPKCLGKASVQEEPKEARKASELADRHTALKVGCQSN